MKREELLRALRGLAVETGSLVCLGCGYEHNCSLHGCAVIREAVEALEKPPNAPLTLEELREMDGEPVWAQYGQYDGEWLIVAWNIYDAISYARKAPFKLSVYSYGDTWLAYRRKPEEAQEKDNEHTPQKETCGITGHPCCHCNPGPCNSRRTGEEK